MARLSYSQSSMLKKCTAEWQKVWDVGASGSTNMTLTALEKRGLIEMRCQDNGGMFGTWFVRLRDENAPPLPPPPPRLSRADEAQLDSFRAAMGAKLLAGAAKLEKPDGWRTEDWEDECRRQLSTHVEKGDPLDVALYAMFCWTRGWSTKAPDDFV